MVEVIFEKSRVVFREGAAKGITHKLNTLDVQVEVYDENNQLVENQLEIADENKIRVTIQQDLRNARVLVKGQVEKKENPLVIIAEQTTRVLMGFKTVSLTYGRTEGSTVPFFKEQVKYFGFDDGFDVPDVKYVLAIPRKDEDLIKKILNEKWLINENLSSNLITSFSENIDYRADFEPVRGIKVNINGNKTYSLNSSQTYVFNANGYAFSEATQMGSFSMSYITANTAFKKIDEKNNYQSEVFDNFQRNRARFGDVQYNRLSQQQNDASRSGLGENAQQVLIPSFLTTYGVYKEKDTDYDITQHMTGLKAVPLPNWQVSINNLSDIEYLKRFLRSVTLNHTYRSKYNISNFETNIDYVANSLVTDFQGNYLMPFNVGTVSIQESFSPLFGIDMAWLNSLSTRFEIKRDRSLNMNLNSFSIIESHKQSYVTSIGYTIKDLQLVINAGSGQRVYKSDLMIRVSYDLGDNVQIIRLLSEEQREKIPETNSGSLSHSFNLTGDYALSESFHLNAFARWEKTVPRNSGSSPRKNLNIGFSVKFNLIQ
ncbi:MAG: cell surface protein SprA [Bacteroidales bacterium]|nr:cell surface protein SprA [Bacteroidales bacterium]